MQTFAQSIESGQISAQDCAQLERLLQIGVATAQEREAIQRLLRAVQRGWVIVHN